MEEDKELLKNWLITVRDSGSGANKTPSRVAGATLTFGKYLTRRVTEEDGDDMEALIHYRPLIDYQATHRDLEFGSHLGLGACTKPFANCFFDALLAYSRNRRPFYTSSGWIGLADEGVAPGDELVILQGGETPFLLRPSDDHYNLVCVCYVHGIMDGEAWKGKKDERMKVYNIH